MFVAWRELWFARGRFGLMGGVVVLITVLVGLLSGLTAGLGARNTSAVAGLPADHLVFAADAGFADSVLGADVAQAWARVPGVRSATPVRISMTRAQVDGRSVGVAVFAVPDGSPLAPVRLRQGVAVVSSGVGGRSTLSIGADSYQAVPTSTEDYYSHAPVVWVTLPADAPATVLALSTSDIDLVAADRSLGTHTVELGDSLAEIGSFAAENGSLQLMRGFLFAISALVVGAFFTVWTIQRGADVAVLKALGASTPYLLRDALGQALVLLAIGAVVGTAIALGLGALVGSAVPFVLDLPTVALPGAVIVVLGLLGAALSIRRITSVDPLTALGSTR
ncbi:ABC transporter permease [Actinokineospora sp. NBRC 105648]|uniref:ABC transporter permease n=1 Tax=Actinokineospora sp. NBRC 105648 TaxID=3032206 RepID=UPI0024A55D16|nr:ABC transporter permease [Actinokineospora sp. NBRC 105648]GLZ41386.1 ABC transporter permease [Actinokineospora sp. NBRC 105648]